MGRPLQLGVLGALLLILTGAGLWLHQPYMDQVLGTRQKEAAVLLVGLAGAVYLGASCLSVRLKSSSRRATWIVLGVAIAMRIAFLFSNPVL